jgi:hypothetical protein
VTPLRTRLAVAALGAGLVLAAPAAALAAPARSAPAVAGNQTDRTIDSVRARCQDAITKRLTALGEASGKLPQAKQLTPEHKSALESIISETTARLKALQPKIAGDTDPAVLKADCQSIFGDNRVFALVLPRTRLVVGADAGVAAANRLDQVAAKLAQAIAKAEAAGHDVTQAKADLESMRGKIDAARSSASGVPDSILGLTPANWNDNHEVLTPARASLRSARDGLKEARNLARQIAGELR